MDFHVSVDLNGAIHTMLDRIKETVSDGRMENCYVPNNPNYQDLWRSSPLVKQDSSLARPQELTPGPRGSLEYGRSSMDLGVNPYGPMSPTEMDPLSNIFSFSSPGYKEFSVFKEKKPAEIADALLSLKHAVVHPGQVTGQLTPLSPGLPPMSSQGGHSALSAGGMGPAPSFSYSVNPHGHHAHAQPGGGGGYAGMSGAGQYAASPAQYADLSAAGHAQSVAAQNQMFPSMSVNVSMSMNVGVPPNNGFHGGGNGSGNALSGEHAQWSPGPHHPAGSHSPHAPSHHYPAHNEIHMQAQYPGYATSAQAYNASYSFGSELRSPTGFANKEMMYHRSTSESYRSAVPKFYSALNNFSLRRKPPTGRVNGAEHGKVNLCRICGKTYARPSTLKTHMRTHSGEKPYKCQTCNKSFSQAANLTAHVRTHSGEKPFRCHICDRRFSQSSSVTTHMRTHSGERPYRCRMCKKAFSDSSTLTKHLRIHSGEKPYQCKLCLLRFSQSGNLNRHMRVHSSNN